MPTSSWDTPLAEQCQNQASKKYACFLISFLICVESKNIRPFGKLCDHCLRISKLKNEKSFFPRTSCMQPDSQLQQLNHFHATITTSLLIQGPSPITHVFLLTRADWTSVQVFFFLSNPNNTNFQAVTRLITKL